MFITCLSEEGVGGVAAFVVCYFSPLLFIQVDYVSLFAPVHKFTPQVSFLFFAKVVE